MSSTTNEPTSADSLPTHSETLNLGDGEDSTQMTQVADAAATKNDKKAVYNLLNDKMDAGAKLIRYTMLFTLLISALTLNNKVQNAYTLNALWHFRVFLISYYSPFVVVSFLQNRRGLAPGEVPVAAKRFHIIMAFITLLGWLTIAFEFFIVIFLSAQGSLSFNGKILSPKDDAWDLFGIATFDLFFMTVLSACDLIVSILMRLVVLMQQKSDTEKGADTVNAKADEKEGPVLEEKKDVVEIVVVG